MCGGVLPWGGLAAISMLGWLGAAGSPATPPFPSVAPSSLLWHVVSGLVGGGVFATARS
ncbi:hypothetical protein VB773_17875 [Haloarculaceae archaeon H-GB2-1]|nr:hypothetical protein [Haloarculaceae archaeon H-GB11]MEA5409256.1 hypothetical protein [Haloarculaceae archaeon H-GB2-1]